MNQGDRGYFVQAIHAAYGHGRRGDAVSAASASTGLLDADVIQKISSITDDL